MPEHRQATRVSVQGPGHSTLLPSGTSSPENGKTQRTRGRPQRLERLQRLWVTIIVEGDTETDVSRALGNEALTFSAHSEASAEGQQGLRQGKSLRTSEVALTLVSLMLTMPCVSVMSGARVGQAALGAPQDCWQGHGALESLRPPTHSHLHRARVEDVCQVRKWVLARAALSSLARLSCRLPPRLPERDSEAKRWAPSSEKLDSSVWKPWLPQWPTAFLVLSAL